MPLDYNLPEWPFPWAYAVHGVHPKHFFYAYAASNPLARDLVVVLPGPNGMPLERTARVTHVCPMGDLEFLGLAFPQVQESESKPGTTPRTF